MPKPNSFSNIFIYYFFHQSISFYYNAKLYVLPLFLKVEYLLIFGVNVLQGRQKRCIQINLH